MQDWCIAVFTHEAGGHATIPRGTSLRESLLLLGAVILVICAIAQGRAWAARSERTLRNANTQQLWVGAYVPGWNQQRLDPRNDHLFDAITYFLHFAVYLRASDGSLELQRNELTPSKMRALVGAAHGAGKQALLVVGGEGAAPGLRIASSPERLPHTLESILSLVDRYGYYGIDVDWEPLAPPGCGSLLRLHRGFAEEPRPHGAPSPET